jgi:hypothetical protein
MLRLFIVPIPTNCVLQETEEATKERENYNGSWLLDEFEKAVQFKTNKKREDDERNAKVFPYLNYDWAVSVSDSPLLCCNVYRPFVVGHYYTVRTDYRDDAANVRPAREGRSGEASTPCGQWHEVSTRPRRTTRDAA